MENEQVAAPLSRACNQDLARCRNLALLLMGHLQARIQGLGVTDDDAAEDSIKARYEALFGVRDAPMGALVSLSTLLMKLHSFEVEEEADVEDEMQPLTVQDIEILKRFLKQRA